ncbi:MAG: DUF1489 domain-containing protein [Alphaproteobacteria bacterium]|nr:DUF1489 domain-containing protein [Alphaproteobacteria bacterium]
MAALKMTEDLDIAPVNILKMSVGIDSVDELAAVQRRRLAEAAADGGPAELRSMTRHAPRRAKAVVAGGSIYWVIKGFVRARQRILRIDLLDEPIRGKRCAFILDPELVRTELQARRPHQGWRYLEAKDAPADLARAAAGIDDFPPELASELRALGLI